MNCGLCGGCVAICPANAITITQTHRFIDKNLCTDCGLCTKGCPVQIPPSPFIKLTVPKQELGNENLQVLKFLNVKVGQASCLSIKNFHRKTSLYGEYDVIVVGAGPAGIVTSLYAGAGGAKVLLIDRKQEIGLPLRCAEGLLEYSFTMAGMDLPNIPFNWLKSRFYGVHVFKGRENTIIPSKGFIVNRTLMEKDMLKDAQKYGVELLLNTNVSNIEKDMVFLDNGFAKAKVIVGADGVDSKIGRIAGLLKPLKLKDLASCIQYTLTDIKVPPNILQMHFLLDYPGGYAWVFPYGIKTAHVGLYIRNKNKQDLLKLLNAFCFSHFPKAKIVNTTYGCIPVSRPPEKLVKNNVLLVGDAARVVFAHIGAGLGNAIVFGKKAGQIIGNMIAMGKPGDYLEIYQHFFEEYKSIFNKFYKKSLFNDKTQIDEIFYP